MILSSVEIITLLVLVMQYLILQRAAAAFLPVGKPVWKSCHQEHRASTVIVIGAVISGEPEGVVTDLRYSLQGKKVCKSVSGCGRKGLQCCIQLMGTNWNSVRLNLLEEQKKVGTGLTSAMTEERWYTAGGRWYITCLSSFISGSSKLVPRRSYSGCACSSQRQHYTGVWFGTWFDTLPRAPSSFQHALCNALISGVLF